MAPPYSPRMLLLLAALFAPATVSAQIPFGPITETFAIINPCTGETVVVDSNTRFVLYPRAVPSGGVHLTTRLLQHGQGVATTPDPTSFPPEPAYYQFAHESVETSNAQSGVDGTIETTHIINLLLIRKGNETDVLVGPATKDDFIVKYRFHVTFSPNRVITASVAREGASCPLEEEP